MMLSRVHSLLIVATVEAVLIGAMFFGGVLATRSSSSGPGGAESLPIGGVAHISVYNAQGEVVSTWTGHNVLFPDAVTAIAVCLSGGPAAISQYSLQGCTGYTTDILVAWSAGSSANCAASSALTKDGLKFSCGVSTAADSLLPSAGCLECTGWQAVATYPSTDFTASNGCVTTCTIQLVIGMQGSTWTGSISGGASYVGGNGFDYLLPSITLSQGDSLQITIAYTVT